MELHEGSFRGTIPCAATQSTGTLQYYAEGLNSDGDSISQYGSDDAPKAVDVATETTATPPAYPDEQPPARCAVGDVGATEPTSGGACGGLDAACGADDCCEEGLSCNEGTCQYEGKKRKKGSYPKNWVGLHFGLDLANVSSDGACSADARKSDNFVCFNGSQTFNDTVSNGAPGKIGGGFTLATMRVMASYERLFGPLGLEGRLGFAFNGGQKPQGGSAFLPIHVEARAKWWLRGTAAFEKPGFRPWLHVGGGIAQVDTKVNVDVVDCNTAPNAEQFGSCQSASDPQTARAFNGTTKITHLQAVKQYGQAFAALGGGLMYAVGINHGAVLNLNVMIPFPSVGFVFEPSIGYEYAF
jgi:hypothetical protein